VTFSVGLELFVDGAWADITDDLSDDGVQITRGRSAEGSRVTPSRMTCQVRNNAGTYSPRNPRSSLFGKIGRNTPVRFWVETGSVRLVQDQGTQWLCDDSAGLSITGDIDLRVDVAPRTWRPESTTFLGLVKGGAYWLTLHPSGQVTIGWNDGADDQALTSTVPVPGGITGRKAVRATLDVDTGDGTAAATFYAADTLTGSWTQVGAVVELGETTAIADSAETLGTYLDVAAEVFGLSVLDGIGGTTRASVDWTAVSSGATTYTDGQSNVWSPYGDAVVTARRYRFVGGVAAWPTRWGLKGAPTARTLIEAGGILRRLGQGASPVQSALRRGCDALPYAAAYWPLEDGAKAAAFLGTAAAPPGRLLGAVTPAGYSDFDGSGPVPTIGDGGRLAFTVPPYANSGEVAVRFLLAVPEDGITSDAMLLKAWTSGTLGWAELWLTTTGGLYTKLYSHLGVLGHTTSTVAFALNGQRVRCSLELVQDGADVDITMATLAPGASSAAVGTDTKSGLTLGAVTGITVNFSQADLGGTAVGHLTVERQVVSLFGLAEQMTAYAGERADTRLLRLAAENDIALGVVGAGAGAERVGTQGIGTLANLLGEAADADGGLLFEARNDDALRYRSLESLWGQDPAVTITYVDNLLNPLDPVDDDSALANRVTVTRAGGGSYTAEDATGPLGTAAPPDGVGVYESSVTLSLAGDAQAEQQAGWRLHLGTVDEARWPKVGLDLAHPVFLADQDLTGQVLALDLGDRLDVTDIPEWLPPGPVSLLVVGCTETITPPAKGERGRSSADPPFHHKIVFTCVPAGPYRIGTFVASGYETSTTGTAGDPDTVLMSDDGTGETNGTGWDSGNWTADGTGSGGGATYESEALRLASGTAGGYASAARTTRTANISDPTTVDISGTWSPDANEPYGAAFIRGNMSGADLVDGYLLSLGKDATAYVYQITDYGGTGTVELGSFSFSASSGSTYGFRLRAEGTRIMARLWSGAEGYDPVDDAATYPWDVDETDATWSSGPVGVTVGAGNAAVQHAITFDDIVVTAADGTAESTETTLTPIAAGPSDTRYGTGGSVLDDALTIDGTSADVLVVYGPAWTEDEDDLPLDLVIGGERVTCTAVGSPSSGVQTLTLTRAVSGIHLAHAAGTAVDLADPSYWGARPLGGDLYVDSSGSTSGDTGGGGGDPVDTETPNTVRIGADTYPLSGVDPGTEGGWGGDPAYPGDRGVDQLIVYTDAYGSETDTNQWGAECPADDDLIVNSVNDREATQDLDGTAIPDPGYVLSGHNAARQWLLAHATVGAQAELIYVAPGGDPGGGEGGGGEGGGEIGPYPSKMISIYKMIFSSTGVDLDTLDPPIGEVRLAFANGSPLGLVGYGAEGESSLKAAVASQRALGVRIVVSIGGAGYTVSLSNTSAFVSQFQAIVTDLGGCDGIDWDIESSAFNRSNVVTISKALKNIYGSEFAITMAPNGSNVGTYLPAAVELHQNNALDNYGQQFYDAPVSLAAAKGRIAEAINAGIPASKLSVGMMIANDSSHWTNTQCADYMADIKATYGVTKAYLWESQRAGTSQWISDMNNIL